jgi:hypothetical protein
MKSNTGNYLILFFLCLIISTAILCYDRSLTEHYASYRQSDFNAFEWDSRTLWRLKPSYHGTAFETEIDTSAQGFRADRIYPLKSEHKFRILTLGDSRTYGFNVNHDETFSSVLEQTLKEQGIDAEVINAGVHGFSAVQCLAYFRELLKFCPDIVIFAPGYNDRRYLIVRSPDNPAAFRNLALVRSLSDFIQQSNLLFGLLNKIGKTKMRELQYHPPPLDTVPVRVEPETFQHSVQDFVSLCRQNNVSPIFLAIEQNPLVYEEVEEEYACIGQENIRLPTRF